MEQLTDEARRRYDDLVAHAADVVVGLDFDGTLSPIVDDPETATIHPDAPGVLGDLARRVRAVVVITGRPARQVVRLGHLERVADALPDGAELAVMGQYGAERWDSRTREFTSPEPPEGLVAFREELPGLLDRADAADAHVEEKGIALAVHTRRLPDAQPAFDRLAGLLAGAAERHGLLPEPGRLVLEVRAPGMDKGLALRTAVDEHGAGGVLFVGDDLGDLQAFEAARDLADHDFPALLVCSGSEEQQALVAISDVVVPGPDGVMALLASYAADAADAATRRR